ncbi:MAG TPA: hypothetical protein VGX91_11920 [Candidatus Cybelea sp.]|jgi:hypothetical protein|nr:hypothetical protein [Candidatus Cybelea sp.]
MVHAPLPVAVLAIQSGLNGKGPQDRTEAVYGGYANPRGDIVLLGKEGAYRVNFKSQTLQRRPPLNPGAQARYDAAQAGEPFEFASKTFRRLSHEQISEICDAHRFRIVGIPIRS